MSCFLSFGRIASNSKWKYFWISNSSSKKRPNQTKNNNWTINITNKQHAADVHNHKQRCAQQTWQCATTTTTSKSSRAQTLKLWQHTQQTTRDGHAQTQTSKNGASRQICLRRDSQAKLCQCTNVPNKCFSDKPVQHGGLRHDSSTTIISDKVANNESQYSRNQFDKNWNEAHGTTKHTLHKPMCKTREITQIDILHKGHCSFCKSTLANTIR